MTEDLLPIPEEITQYLGGVSRIHEVGNDARHLLIKCFHSDGMPDLTEQEAGLQLSANESAAVLSALHKQTIATRYIKEMARDIISQKTGKTTPRRLHFVRKVGGASMYSAREVVDANIRSAKENAKTA